MALSFLLDENIPARIRRAIDRHNLSREYPLDAVVVGEVQDLPLGAADPAILRWAAREERILLTEDKSTMPRHLAAQCETERHSPGVFLIRHGMSTSSLIEFLTLVAYASDPEEWRNRIEYIP